MTRPTPTIPEFLVNLGNRFAAFGPEGRPPASSFDPEQHTTPWPRVADELEGAVERIAATLTVPGMQVETSPWPEHDLVLRDGDRTTFVDIKIRERDPKERDFREATRLIDEAHAAGRPLVVWFFNLERLKAVVVSGRGADFAAHAFVPWDVWSISEEGVFTRAQVVERVADWERRIDGFYLLVRSWLTDREGLTTETNRSMTMSEELMQRYAVADRELPILDVLQASEVIASLVPRALWIIGGRGRIDLITRTDTRIIVDVAKANEAEWHLVSPESRRVTMPLDRASFLGLLGVS